METIKEQIISFLDSGKPEEALDMQSLKELTVQYPYFQGLLFFYLKNLYSQDEVQFRSELTRLAPFVSDRKALFYAIFSEEYALFFQKTGKTELSVDRTDFLLSAFFNQMDDAEQSSNNLDENILTSGIVSVDYFSYLEKMDDPVSETKIAEETPQPETPSRHQTIINDFIEKSDNGEDFKIRLKQETDQETSEFVPPIEEESLDDSMFFTETLSRIYIKQKKYKEAYKIIKQLSLNYPEKNTYFADQIRFLEKLIINSSK